MKPSPGAVAPLLVALAWTVALMVDSTPVDSGWNVFLISFGMMLIATVSVVGLVVVGGRWAYRLGWVAVAVGAVVAVLRPVDLWWWIGLVVTLAAGLMLVSVASGVRKLPAAAGPGERAVLVPLVLITVPAIIGLLGVGPRWVALLVGLSAPLFAFFYSRVIFGGLLGVRIIWPALAVILAFFLDLPWGLVSALLGAGVAALAWHPSVQVAFHPPREVGSTFPIPPELAPTEILDAARIDDRGKPK